MSEERRIARLHLADGQQFYIWTDARFRLPLGKMIPEKVWERIHDGKSMLSSHDSLGLETHDWQYRVFNPAQVVWIQGEQE